MITQTLFDAILIGTGCTEAHIVPVTIMSDFESNMLDDVDVSQWVDVFKPNLLWVNIDHRRYRFKKFAQDDNVSIGTEYVVYYEEQPTALLGWSDENKYLKMIDGGFGRPWYGNIIVVKCMQGGRVVDITVEDKNIAKRCAVM